MKFIIISGSSDIGSAIIDNLIKQKRNEIIYTFNSKKVERFKNLPSFKLNIKSRNNISKFTKNKTLNKWNNLVILPATQNPIGLFSEVDKNDWANSIDINFTNQMYLIKELISKRDTKSKNNCNVILWAGTGSNSAPKYYSAYTISKIAQTKMCELLDKEFKDVKFSIIGPGWVKTKIHEQTIKAGKFARENYKNTISRIRKNKFNPMQDVISCFNSILKMKKRVAGGRNFSVQFDKWSNKNLLKILDNDDNMYKLRRDFNDLQLSDLEFNVLNILEFIKKNKNFNNPNSLIYKTFKRIMYLNLLNHSKKKFKIKYIDSLINFYNEKNKKKIKLHFYKNQLNIKKLINILEKNDLK